MFHNGKYRICFPFTLYWLPKLLWLMSRIPHREGLGLFEGKDLDFSTICVSLQSFFEKIPSTELRD